MGLPPEMKLDLRPAAVIGKTTVSPINAEDDEVAGILAGDEDDPSGHPLVVRNHVDYGQIGVKRES